MGKTPEYTKRAVASYRQNFDIVQIRFPKGTKEKLAKKGNVNAYITNLVLEDLQKDKEDE